MNPFKAIYKLINEHASTTILKQRISLVSDQFNAIEREKSDLEKQNTKLEQDIKLLKDENYSYKAYSGIFQNDIKNAKQILSQSQHLILMVGYTCCLKTTVAKRISKLLKLPTVETSCLDTGINPEKQQRDDRYHRAELLAKTYFKQGLSIIVDGTFLEKKYRKKFSDIVKSRQGASLIIIWAEMPPKQVHLNKLNYKRLALDSPHKECINDADEQKKLENPTKDDDPITCIRFNSGSLLVTPPNWDEHGLAKCICSLITTSVSIGKLSE